MILVDAGPLIALLDRDEPDFTRCTRALAVLNVPMITTWPALTEAMYLLGARGGWPAQQRLWALVLRGDLVASMPDEPQVRRSAALMEKYRDVPMDLADASLVALAEALNHRQVFTLDADFRVYRFRDRQPFDLVP